MLGKLTGYNSSKTILELAYFPNADYNGIFSYYQNQVSAGVSFAIVYAGYLSSQKLSCDSAITFEATSACF